MTHSDMRIIALDTVGSRAEGSLGDLFSEHLAALDPTVLDTLDFPWFPGPIPPLRQRASAIMARLSIRMSQGHTIVAHCSNAALACALTSMMIESGHQVDRLIMFAPLHVDLTVIEGHASTLFKKLGMPADQSSSLSHEVWSEQNAQDFSALKLTAVHFQRLATELAGNLGVDEDEIPEFASSLCEQYMKWLSHLASNLHADRPTVCRPVEIVEEDIEAGRENIAKITSIEAAKVHHSPLPTAFTDENLRSLFTQIIAAPPLSADRAG